MQISGFVPILLVGIGGGLLAELLKWYELRESPNLPEYAHRPRYWVMTIALAIFGGLYGTLYGIEARDALLVANLGLTAPLVLKSVAGATLPVQPTMRGRGRVTMAPSLRQFVAGR